MPTEIEHKLIKYFELTGNALKKVRISSIEDANLRKSAEEILDLSKRYFEDAKYFSGRGEYINAFGAVVYSHAFLDIGAIIGLFDVDDDNLFMVDRNSRGSNEKR